MRKNLWERQGWDTGTSYDRFFNYYLPQPPPRSVDRAFRAWRRSEGKPVAEDKRAPHYWWYWAGGKDSNGNEIPTAVTWEVRASAYDDMRYAQEIVAREREDRERLAQHRILVTAAFGKVSQAWSQFKPGPGDEFSLSELVNALRVVSQEMREAFHFPAEPQQMHVHHYDWRTEVVRLVEDGVVAYEDVQAELGHELAQELFAGRSISPPQS